MPRTKNIPKIVSRVIHKWDSISVRKFINENYSNIDSKEVHYHPSISKRKKIIERSKITGLLCLLHPNKTIEPIIASSILNTGVQPCNKCSIISRANARKDKVQKRFNNSIKNLPKKILNLDFENYLYVQNIGKIATIENLNCFLHPEEVIPPTTIGKLKKGNQPCKKCAQLNKYRNKAGQKPATNIESLLKIQEYDLSNAEIIRRKGDSYKYKKAYLVGIYCEEHNLLFEQRLDVFKKGLKGCKECISKERSISLEFVKEYLLQNNIMIDIIKYAGSSSGKSKWKCINCGCEWHNQFDQIKSGYGCKPCSNIKRIANATMTEDKAKNLIFENFIDEFSLFSYGGKATTLSQFKCNTNDEHQLWETSVSAVIGNQSGCPICKSSRGNRAVARWLSKNGYKFIAEKRFEGMIGIGGKPLRADFYLQDHNTVIEFDGEQHKRPIPFGGISSEAAEINFEKVKSNDKIKNEYLKKNGINLIRITSGKNIKEFLNSRLANRN